MLRELQAIGWSLLDSSPVEIAAPVTVLLGQNGSGKSSFMDGAKALLGARRFGANRSPASYRYSGRAGAPAASRAYLLGRMETDGSLPYGQTFTVIMEAGASRRYFRVEPGDALIRDREMIPEALRILGEKKRSEWMTPAEYQRRVLDPLGFGPAMRRFLELPQGELAKVLDRDSDRLVELLLELSGGRDAARSLERAAQALDEARQAAERSSRSLERSELRLRRAELDGVRAEELLAARQHLAELLARAEELLLAGPERAPALYSAAAINDLGLKLIDGYWSVPPGREAQVADRLGPGEKVPGVNSSGEVCGPPAADPNTAAVTADLHRRLSSLVEQLRAADIEPQTPGGEDLSPAELVGALQALIRDGIPEHPGPRPDLDELRSRVRADAQLQAERQEVLEQSTRELRRAEGLYASAAQLSLGRVAERFSALCLQAGMDGVMSVTDGGKAIEIEFSEERGGELRPLFGVRNTLSGGWKATVIVFAVIAALSSTRAPGLVLIDEVGSSLDEERLEILGRAFRKLGEGEGATIVLTIPSKTISQTVARFATRQIAFFRPEPSEQLAPPPHDVELLPAA